MRELIAFFIILPCGVFAGGYGGGVGTPEDPYQIWTVEHLDELGVTTDDYDKAFILMADLDLGGIVYTAAPIAPDIDPIKWGPQGTSFRGTLDGNSHTIRNLTVQNEDCDNIALIGWIEGGSRIKNLMLENVSMLGRNCVGTITATNLGIISNCHSSGLIVGSYIVGGLVGFNDDGVIKKCSADCSFSYISQETRKMPNKLGGLVGHSQFGTITDSWAKCVMDVELSSINIGGLIGENRAATIEHCWAQPTIHAENSRRIGGLCGYNWGSIRNSITIESDIQTKGDYVGGLVGFNYSLISQCIAEGTIKGKDQCGGLIGYNKGYVIDSYSSVDVNSEKRSGGFSAGNHYGILRCYSLGAAQCRSFQPGGFVGRNTGYVDHCFWDIETSGVYRSDSADGMNSQQLKERSTYKCWGDDVWVIEENIGYPKLMWENTLGVVIQDGPAVYGGGSGTANDPFLIYTVEELTAIGKYPQDLSRCYKLMNDLDLSGIEFLGIGFGFGFEGVFDGNGCAIHNMSLNGDLNYTGLFCVILKKGTVKNLNVLDYHVSGYDYVGAVAGKNEGVINNCYTKGYISVLNKDPNPDCYGGLTGFNFGEIIHCQADVEFVVKFPNSFHLGGLVGLNRRVIRQSCSSGVMDITGEKSRWFGGLVGAGDYHSGIYDCHSSVNLTVNGKDCHEFGGFIGWQNHRTRIENSYYNGIINVHAALSPKHYGGFIGLNGSERFGGNGIIKNCFWDTERSGLNNGIGINYTEGAAAVGLTTEQLWDIKIYADASWSIDSEPNGNATWIALPGSSPELSYFVETDF